jgi:hypothetical protein
MALVHRMESGNNRRMRPLTTTLAVLSTALVGTFMACSSDPTNNGQTSASTSSSSSASSSGSAGAGGGAGAGGTGGEAGQGGTGGQGGSSGVYQPKPGTSWQWQLSGLPLDTSFDVEVYDIDLVETKATEIDALHAAGRKVICYFSAGSWDSFRPDAGDFSETDKGSPLDPPFADELWLDIRSDAVRSIMKKRLDLAVSKKCDAVEPDNVDGYSNDNGFGLTATDQLDFNKFIANEAHARGLSVGLKNDIEQLGDLVDSFDWALNEECFTYSECDTYAPTFIQAGKAVFHAEYVDAGELATVCAVTKPLMISTIVKNIELDAFRLACP